MATVPPWMKARQAGGNPAPPPPALPSSLTTTPPGTPGLTNSVPVNIGIGGGVLAASNGMTAASAGTDVMWIAKAMALMFNDIKQQSWINQHKYGKILLVLLAIGVGFLIFGVLGHISLDQAFAKGCALAMQTWMDYTGYKVTGLPGLPPADDPS